MVVPRWFGLRESPLIPGYSEDFRAVFAFVVRYIDVPEPLW